MRESQGRRASGALFVVWRQVIRDVWFTAADRPTFRVGEVTGAFAERPWGNPQKKPSATRMSLQAGFRRFDPGRGDSRQIAMHTRNLAQMRACCENAATNCKHEA